MGATSLNREQLERYRIKIGYYDQFKSKKKTRKKNGNKPKPTKQETEFKKQYQKYLKSEKWKEIKCQLFKERGSACEKCGSGKSLQVHHLHYGNVFRELLEDLQILCKKCHRKEHGIK
jgi:5-methylcytosine-specific restriction endonuclease McrA